MEKKDDKKVKLVKVDEKMLVDFFKQLFTKIDILISFMEELASHADVDDDYIEEDGFLDDVNDKPKKKGK